MYKKLLDETKIIPIIPAEEYVPLFSWHANLLVINRKKAIILPDCKEIIYTYDFGDNWKHYLEIDKIVPAYLNNYADCLEGVGDTPPEDIGNESGYENFLEAISDPDNEGHEFNVEWGKMQGYSKFDIDEVNRRLKLQPDSLSMLYDF